MYRYKEKQTDARGPMFCQTVLIMPDPYLWSERFQHSVVPIALSGSWMLVGSFSPLTLLIFLDVVNYVSFQVIVL